MVGKVAPPGRINSLAQTLIKYTAPGVPDTYQGSELWDFRLVDPDNRTPVDYELRQNLLNELKGGLAPEEILRRAESGLPKLWVVHSALMLRIRHPEWFGGEAEYAPLAASGPKSEHLVGYVRGDGVATIVPRWPSKLGDNWSATAVELPQGMWKNLLTGDRVNGGRTRVQALLQRFPVALLEKELS
jgi:(1->4)-alpha-D-glucan 1-alpha-D-glucosylmutase